jgi:hypothetical protein
MFVTLSRVRGWAGWRESLGMQLVHGTSCNPQLWHAVNVTISADTITVGECKATCGNHVLSALYAHLLLYTLLYARIYVQLAVRMHYYTHCCTQICSVG